VPTPSCATGSPVASPSITVETVEKEKSDSNINNLAFDSQPPGLSKDCRKVSKRSAIADYPTVVIGDDGQPCAHCGWCGSGAFWRPASPDHRWCCQACEPANRGEAHVWFALP
jgi:hypothetical protein